MVTAVFVAVIVDAIEKWTDNLYISKDITKKDFRLLMLLVIIMIVLEHVIQCTIFVLKNFMSTKFLTSVWSSQPVTTTQTHFWKHNPIMHNWAPSPKIVGGYYVSKCLRRKRVFGATFQSIPIKSSPLKFLTWNLTASQSTPEPKCRYHTLPLLISAWVNDRAPMAVGVLLRRSSSSWMPVDMDDRRTISPVPRRSGTYKDC